MRKIRYKASVLVQRLKERKDITEDSNKMRYKQLTNVNLEGEKLYITMELSESKCLKRQLARGQRTNLF